VTLESELPGLREWNRVRDWRLNQISKLSNVEYYLESVVDREQVLEFAADRVVVATGAKWRRDGTGRWHDQEIPGWQTPSVMTPDDVLGGVVPDGPVVVYDDDHYYIGGVIAEKLRGDGLEVTLVTPANEVSTWTIYTDEQHRIQERILTLGIHLKTGASLSEIQSGGVIAECIYTGRKEEIPASAVVLVTSRVPQDDLYYSLRDEIDIERIGDCLAPGTIATAVYSGHRYAREMDAVVPVGVPFLRER
jgi:dimethylamine/trimethylamine dehydrogenase